MHLKIRGKRVRCERWNQETEKYEKITIVDLGREIPEELRELFTAAELEEYDRHLEEFRAKEQAEWRKTVGNSYDLSTRYLLDDLRKDPKCLTDEKQAAIVDSALEIIKTLAPERLEPPKPTFRAWLRGLLD